ncbi:MAG: hypothetical protein Q8M76_07040 [Spirochaetaceae bacterium]|nr:hypothetical protein [Spirochaetaceae bacterium]
MNAEFHYYAVYYLCRRSGMDQERCTLIATSSQYVDNAIHSYEFSDAGGYRTHVAQNYIFWDESTSRDIYLPFHFVPGDGERAARERIDGAASRWTVTPDSPLAKELLVDALRTGDPFRIGIALHAYADTWAHQHFSGKLEAGNAVSAGSPLPPAGHLQALRAPDDAGGSWIDGRLVPDLASVINRERFLDAARKIYRYLRTSLRSDFMDEDFVLSDLDAVWRRSPNDMQARLADFVVDLDVPPYDRRIWLAEAGIADETADEAPIAGYDKLLWLRSELTRRSGAGDGIRRVHSGGRFSGSSLHRWNEAAREHRERASRLLASEGLL